MATSSVQRQSIVSVLVTYTGFAFGALNLLVLQNLIINRTEFGLTRVITDAGLLAATFATLGAPAIVSKFMPFHRRYLPAKKNDLPFIGGVIVCTGLLITAGLLLILKPWLVEIFGRRNPLFEPHYNLLIPFFIGSTLFMFMEPLAWYAGKTVAANFMKELLFRALTTVLFLLLALNVIGFSGFMKGFALIYYLPFILLFVIVYRTGHLPIVTTISSVTRRLRKKMAELGGFVFAAVLANIAMLVADTLFLASMYSFEQAGVWAMAQYFATVLEAPMRSLISSSVPMVSEYWRQKNYTGLLSVYRKSCINLLLIGLALGGLIIINIPNLLNFLKGEEYRVIYLPLIILVISKLINLGTGLNEVIIKLSTRWRFDFLSTIIYSLIGIPLNFFLIKYYGMTGAAVANAIAMLFYNGIRWWFLVRHFRLQPFTSKFGEVILIGALLALAICIIPYSNLWFVDAAWRSLMYISVLGFIVIRRKYSQEVVWLWNKWSRKITGRSYDQ